MVIFMNELVDATAGKVIAYGPSSMHLICIFVISMRFIFLHFIVNAIYKLVSLHIILIILL